MRGLRESRDVQMEHLTAQQGGLGAGCVACARYLGIDFETEESARCNGR